MTDPVENLSELKHRLTPADWQIICAYVEAERRTSDNRLEAARAQGWNEAIEAAAVAYQTEAETWLQLPARGACSRLGAKVIRALSVPEIVENTDGDL